ncbi:DUF1533 domain-containing protein [Halalkalibacter oceani]|uniref:DUF1533 domain-containing protein n=1 Tax=Halalkalibacter oceani TaxID=1653776 RepID=UPI003397DD1A
MFAPVLFADVSSATVDYELQIQFVEDADWRDAVTDVLVDGVSIGVGNWNLVAGELRLNPASIASLQYAGDRTITVIATGYNNAEVVQPLAVGAVDTSKTTMNVNPALQEGQISTVTLVAKDQYENLVSGHQFKYDVNILSNDTTTIEQYSINGVVHTVSASFVTLPLTDSKGEVTFEIQIPATVDPEDGLLINIDGQNISFIK